MDPASYTELAITQIMGAAHSPTLAANTHAKAATWHPNPKELQMHPFQSMQRAAPCTI